MKKSTLAVILFFFFLLPLFSTAQSQSKRDSVRYLIRHASDDSLRAVYYLELGDLYLDHQEDSSVYYSQKAFDIARKAGYMALAGKCLNYIAIAYIYQSEYDSTVAYLKRSIEYKKQAGDSGGLANAYNNLGIIYKNRGDYGEAMEYLSKTARLRKSLTSLADSLGHRNNIEKLGHVYNNQGNIYYQFGDFSRAIALYKRSLEHYEQVGYNRGISACYNNIGNVFEEQKRYNKALDYYTRALELNRQLGVVRNIGTCLNNIGEVHLKSNRLKEARRYFEESLEYRKKATDKRGISAVYSNLAMVNMKIGRYERSLDQLYNAFKLDNEMGDKKAMAQDLVYLARVYRRQGNINQAVSYAQKGRTLADSIDAPLQEKASLELLARCYEQQGHYRQALELTRQYEAIEDFLFNQEKTKLIEEMETRYQLEKKQQEIQEQNQLLEEKDHLIQKQKVINYAYGGGILFVMAVSLLLYYNYRQKRRANLILQEQKDEIESQNEELLQQNEEIKNQRDELERHRNLTLEQRNQIALKNTELTSSIQYAQNIQSGMLISERSVREIFPNHFILYKPKDIVSGDFYWVQRQDERVFFATVDCTGHGVPGAFMSVLGLSLLNDLVRETKHHEAGDLLNRLRVKVIQALRKDMPQQDYGDRMDISLCIWERNQKTLQYAGAYQPLYLLKNGDLIEYKANRIPVGIERKLEQSFDTHHIPVEEGDMVYLFTDGYPDQISYDQMEKMKIARFKKLIGEIASLNSLEQKIRLEEYFDRWKGPHPQTDDVLVMGVKF
ncbi:MAG TPA: tetratricopeptide repeat protein [Bacteroidales bacterium]|nr:tetratricopeptide repeat protein [Bacteroidales bacterium]